MHTAGGGVPSTCRAAPASYPPIGRRSPRQPATARGAPRGAKAPRAPVSGAERRRSRPAEAPASVAGEELVRVRADRLDELLAAVGELIVATGRAMGALGEKTEDARRLDAATVNVYDVVHNLRLRPFSDVCAGLPRAARDVAAAAGKEVDAAHRGRGSRGGPHGHGCAPGAAAAPGAQRGGPWHRGRRLSGSGAARPRGPVTVSAELSGRAAAGACRR
jgi:hypothetical protein